MQIHQDDLSEINRYIENNKHLTLEDTEQQFQNYIRNIQKIRRVDSSTSILEIGTGTGWFPLTCKLRGISCKGLEISPQLVSYAREFGRRQGIEPDIELGNIEEDDIGSSQYDVIIASSVFEHVEHWQKGIQKIFRALKPGGIFFFSSTNKFSFTSGEYDFPLYGWLPNRWRYQLRICRQGPDVMKLGIDFHQFRYPQLRRAFKQVGFSKVYDRIDLAAPNAEWKKRLARLCQALPPLKHLVLTFSDATVFICIK